MMTKQTEWTITSMGPHIEDNALFGFERYQRTTAVLRQSPTGLREELDQFEDRWDESDLTRIASELRRCIACGGHALAAHIGDTIAGFASVEAERFGPEDSYVEMTFLHVSFPFRGHGLGRVLLKHACSSARRSGARLLYIGAHPATETQRFYKSCGCRPANYIHQPVFDREPLDIQLELDLFSFEEALNDNR